jgi:uridine kinase
MSALPSVLPFSPATLNTLANRIREIQTTNEPAGRNTIVSIAGGSSTGKSTQVAEGLRVRLTDSQIIGQDNFQLGRDYDLTTDPLYRWDGLGNYGLPESRELLDALQRKQPATMPVYTFEAGQRTGQQTVRPTPIVLFEGLYAGFGALREACDLLIYVEMPLYARLLRRLFRNTHERYRADPSLSLRSTLSGGVLPAHRDLVRQQRDTADVILQMPYAFADSIARFGLAPIKRTYLPEQLLFTFPFGEDSAWQIDADNSGGLHVGLFYRGDLYLSFPTDADTLHRLTRLDLMGC